MRAWTRGTCGFYLLLVWVIPSMESRGRGEMAFSWVCVVSGSCQVSLDLAILLGIVASVM